MEFDIEQQEQTFEYFTSLPLDMISEVIKWLSPRRKAALAATSKFCNTIVESARKPCKNCSNKYFNCCDEWMIDILFKNTFQVLVNHFDYFTPDFGNKASTTIGKNLDQKQLIGIRNIMTSWYNSLKPIMTKELTWFLLNITKKAWFLPCQIKNATFPYVRISTCMAAFTVCNKDGNYRFQLDINQYYDHNKWSPLSQLEDFLTIECGINENLVDKDSVLDIELFTEYYERNQLKKKMLIMASEYDPHSIIYGCKGTKFFNILFNYI